MVHHAKERLFGPMEVPILKTVGRKEVADFLDQFDNYLLIIE